MEKFTTQETLEKLAPCASSQANESLHGIVGALASKRLFLGRSHQWKYRNAMAGLKKSVGPSYGQAVFRKLNISIGRNTTIWLTRMGNQWKYHQSYKKRPETKQRRNILKTQRKRSGKRQKQKEGVQYESECDLNSQLKKREREKTDNMAAVKQKKRKTNEELEAARIFKCCCGKAYTTNSYLKKHQIAKRCQNTSQEQ